MKARLAAVAQLLIGLGLLAYIGRHLHRSGQLEALLQAWRASLDNTGLLVIGFAGFGVCLLLCIVRWRLILAALGFTLPFRQAAALTLFGHFFNAFLLGATGGDLVKAWYAARHTPDRKAEIVTTIALDRLLGLIAIVVLAPLGMLLRLHTYWAHPQTQFLLLLMLALLAGALTALPLLFNRNLFQRWPALQRLVARHTVGRLLRRVYDTMQLALAHRGLMARTLALSAANHLAAVGIAVAFGFAAGLPLAPLDYVAAILSVNLLAALPITPSGIGTRETAALLLLGALGASPGQAVSVSLMLFGVNLAWSAIGGLVYAATVARTPRPTSANTGNR